MDGRKDEGRMREETCQTDVGLTELSADRMAWHVGSGPVAGRPGQRMEVR